MSRHERPELGSELLTAVSASLAVLKRHLTSADPKVSLRAAAELTKLLSVCARHGITLETVEVPPPDAGPTRRTEPTAGDRSHRPIGRVEGGSVPPAAAQPAVRARPVGRAEVADHRPLPTPVGPPPPDRELAARPGGKRIASFLGPPVGNAVTSGSG